MTRLQRIVNRLTRGAEALARTLTDRATAWIHRGRRTDLTGWQAALGSWVRTAMLAAVLYGMWRLVRAAPALLWLVVALLTIAVWRAGRPRWTPPAPAAAAAAEPVPAEAPPLITAADLIALIREAIGTRSGVHLTVLAHHLSSATGQVWTTASVRAVCEVHGVPVQRGVRMGSSSPSTGVRLDALPDPSQPPPVAGVGGVVVAGQDPATPPATATATPGQLHPEQGEFVLVDDPADHARTHVLWRTRKGVNGE